MIRHWPKFLPLGLLVLILTGCSGTYNYTIDKNNAHFFGKYFIIPLSDTLDWFANHLWGQYGLSIIVVTLIIRLVLLPLTLKQYKSSKKMQEIQPELKKLKEKYKDDTKKQQEETMKLFQQNGVNPMAGCLPLVIQMPILIALYRAIMGNGQIKTHHFLWVTLGQPDHYYILPILAALTSFLQQKMMSSQVSSQMKGLMYVFPVMIFVMAMNFPSALPLYWVFGNLFMIVQSYFIYGKPKNKAIEGGGSK